MLLLLAGVKGIVFLVVMVFQFLLEGWRVVLTVF